MYIANLVKTLTSQPFFITANTKKFQVNINNGNRTEWSPIQSVIMRVMGESNLINTSMITDRIGQQEVLVPN